MTEYVFGECTRWDENTAQEKNCFHQIATSKLGGYHEDNMLEHARKVEEANEVQVNRTKSTAKDSFQ